MDNGKALLINVPELALLRIAFPEGVLLVIGDADDQAGVWSIGASPSADDQRIIGTGRHKNVRRAAKQAVDAAIKWLERTTDGRAKPLSEVLAKEPCALMWEMRRRRGRMSEARVLAVLRKGGHPIPHWVLSVHTATPEEDARGIDVVVRTAHGDLWLQIKRNKHDIEAFRAAHPDERILVYYVDDRIGDGKLRKILCAGLVRTYAALTLQTTPTPLPPTC